MKKFYSLFLFLLTFSGVWAQCPDLFFSEYIEGSSNNKAIEVYNPSDTTVDLSNYEIHRFNNGATTPSATLQLTGMLASGGVFVAGNSSAIAAITGVSDTLSSITFFNGDDAMVLLNVLTGDTLDIIGIVGQDPGTNWTVGTGATSEFTLVRMPSVQMGTTDWSVSMGQWMVFPQDMADSLGSHTGYICSSVSGCTSDLFFSEYLEGSGSNKSLEIFNPMNTSVDLNDYVVYRYNNGATIASDSLRPQGTLAGGDVFVASNSSSNSTILAVTDTTQSLSLYNGDDALVLINRVTGDTLDVVGEVGVDPGSAWTVGTGATANFTLIRKYSIQQGNSDWATAAAEWDVYPIDMADSLGFHNMMPCTGVTPPSVAFGASSIGVIENTALPLNVTVSISNASMTTATSVDVIVNTGLSTATGGGVDYTYSTTTVTWAAGDTANKTVTINIVDDLIYEGNETIALELSNVSSGAIIGSPSSVPVTIFDNETPNFPTYPIGTVTTVDTSGVVDSNGVYCRITGTVYGIDLRGGAGVQFFMRDNTGGIAVFSTSLGTYAVNQTDSIEAYGTIGQFNGLTQLSVDSINILSTGAGLETPDVITALQEVHESDLVEFQCAALVNPAQWTGTGSGFNVDVTNGTDTIDVRIDNDVDLYSMPAPTGTFTVRGMGSQFDNSNPFTDGYQLLPRDSNDIIVATVAAGFTWASGGVNIINFSNTSTGATTYAWDFGDGNTSTAMNPSHTYATGGTYTVSLISTGSCGADTVSMAVSTSIIPTYPIGTVTTEDTNGVADSNGVYCRITGTVYGVDLRGGNGVQFFMRDNTGGIALFSSSLNTYVVNQTDSIEAYGTVGQFNGLTQLSVDSINIIATGATLETPDVITTLSEITESDLVEFQCATLVNPAQWTGTGSGFNVDVTNGTDTIQVRIDNDVDLYSQPAPTGTFTVRGMGGQFDSSNPYDSGYQLLPRDSNDIVNSTVSAAFTYTSGGLNTINFTDASTGASSWAWDFGDGNTSTQQNPTNAYATGGTYTVTLIAGSACGNDTTTQSVLVSGIPTYPIGTVTTEDTNGVADSNGVYCRITGTVYGVDLRGGNGVQFFMRDNTGGIALFSSSLNTYVVNQTDSIEAYGTVGQFNGLTQLSVDSINIIATGATLETPDVVTTLSEITESDLVEFQCATLVNPAQWTGTGSGFNVDVTNGTDTIQVRIDNDVDLYAMAAPTGTFTVRGMGGQFDSSNPYDSGYQLLPRDSNDIVSVAVTAAFTSASGGINVVNFTNASTGATTYSWDFGDGNTSTQMNPSHTYATAGTFTVTLIASNACGADTVSQPVTTSGVPYYPIGTVTTVNASGITDSLGIYCQVTGTVYGGDLRGGNGVQFTIRDFSGGIGVFESALNTYTVNETDSIRAYGYIGQFFGLTQIDVDSIVIISTGATLETPDVVTSLSEITESDLVEFQCATLINPAQWTGSGSGFNVDVTNGTDTILVRIDNDVDLYSMPAPTGTFTVRGIGGQFDSNSPYDSGYQLLPRDSNDVISVPAPVANFGFTSLGGGSYSFSDSSANATGWAWDFGDGNTSTSQNPTHTYSSAGNYIVTLAVTGTCTNDTVQKTVINSNIPYYSIGTVNTIDTNGVADSIGVQCQITGTVYGVDLRGGSGVQFFMRDFSGGIAVFSASLNTYTVTETDTIRAYGTVAQFNGLTQLNVDSITIITTGASLETPDVITALGEVTESDLVEFQCATLVNPAQWTGTGSGFNVDVTNGTDTILVRIDNDVNLYSQPAPTGVFTVRGMGSQFDSSSPYDSGYQLLPRDSNDIILTPAPMANFGITNTGTGSYSFSDSSMNATSWMWNFGDGGSSTAQNPSHTYLAGGTYLVSLIVSNGCSNDTTTDSVSFSIAGFGCGTDLFFSEYIEGSSNNKALEVFNPGDTAVILSNYRIYRYNNGSPTPSDSITPVGILASGDVWVAGNPSAVTGITGVSDTLSTITFFNGDDALMIKNMVTGDTLDIIGVIGVDPGTNWTVGAGATSEFTLVRMPTVNQGTTNWGLSVGQWIVAPRDTLDSLGFHNMNPCGGPVVPTVTFNGASQTVTEANVNVTVNVSILNHSATDTTWVEVALNTGSSTATNGADFNYALDTLMWLPGDSLDKSVTVQILDDVLVEQAEDIVLNLQNVSPNAIIGGNTYTITIIDDDIPYYPIGTINTVDASGVADSLGLRCKITGTVHGVNLRPSGLQFTLIDYSGGIGVFSFTATSGYVVNETDSIAIIGTIGQFNGLTQITSDSVEFLMAGATLQTPTVLTALGEATESNMTQFNCAWIIDSTQWTGSGSGFNVDITNGTDTIQMRIDNDVNLYSMPAPTGIFNVVGIGGQFDASSPYTDGYQLLPRYDLDIISQPAVTALFGKDSLGGNQYNFSDSSTNATSWMWTFGDGGTSTQQNPSHTYASAGTYTVTLVAMNDCSSDTATMTFDLLNGREDDLSAALALFPNPARGQVNVSLQSLESGNVTISVLNLFGQEVARREVRTSGRLDTQLDLSSLSAGVYMVKVSQNGRTGVKKLVLQ